MTWQRIDENTYIDDTLVTCAEYQLFLDEMREQGKYYQPDHWTSYQFPDGQAREPVLGVRYSDAVAFCEWLSEREKGEWKFRLPNQEEAKNYPSNYSGKSLLGFWIRENHQLIAWFGAIPDNPRALVTDKMGLPEFDGYNHENLAQVSQFDLDMARSHAFARDFDRVRDLIHAVELSLNRSNVLNYSKDIYLARALDCARDLVRALVIDLVSNTKNPINFDNYLQQITAFALNLDHILDLNITSMPQLDRALTIYFDLITLQERIAGRSPAFEGIRLVRERVK